MSAVGLEIAKTRRRGALPLALVVVAGGVAWGCTAGSASLQSRPGSASPALVVDGFTSLMALVMPLLVAVVVVRVVGAELDGGMLDQLLAMGARRSRLAAAKLALIALVLLTALGAGIAGTLAWGLAHGIPVDGVLAGQALLLTGATAVELAAPLLALALRAERQAAVIGAGLALALLSQVLLLAPKPVQMLLPNTQILAASPTRWVLEEGTIAGYAPNSEGTALLPAVLAVVAVVVAGSLLALRRGEAGR